MGRLRFVAAVWGGVGVASLVVRFVRRRANARREARVAEQGGLLPHARTAVAALAHRARATPARLALEGADGTAYTWAEYHASARAFGAALRALAPDGGVAVHAFNCPEWFFSALGAMAAGWTVSGIYTTNTYAQAAHVSEQ